MATSSKLKVMISSRCKDMFPAPGAKDALSLTDVRKTLKKSIEGEKIFGKKVFEVWINEDAPPANHSADSWEVCLKQVRDCDVLIVLSNGSSGWAQSGADIGICHAEYMEGLATAPGKVSLIELPPVTSTDKSQKERDARFSEFLQQQAAFRGGIVPKTQDELTTLVRDAIREALVALAQRGVKSDASSRFDRGQALDWTRMDFRERSMRMRATMKAALTSMGRPLADDLVAVDISSQPVAFQLHAIPASFSIGAAREMVGRPFLSDHERLEELKAAAGPVHLIACHRSISEGQAIGMLGFPDATVVSGSFGVYVADDVQKVQFICLKGCRDESQLRHQLQRFMAWLEQTGESARLAGRARSRTKIVQAIHSEIGKAI